MNVHVDSSLDIPVIYVDGEVDMSNTHHIDAAVAGAVANDAFGAVLDLSKVTYLDSAGVRLLFQLDSRLAVHQQRLVLVVPASAPILRALQAAGVIGSLALAPALADALLIARTQRRVQQGPSGAAG